ncbi:MAG TPA: hypothetical protein VKR43_19485 [Bryobacteraceae bacterium]|nr:hypothetical protein [Bryobacteraceae bacterium]
MKISGFTLFLAAALAALLGALAGCGSPGDFNWGKVTDIIQGNPVKLDAEYVMLSQPEFDCGLKNDLWETPSVNGDRSVARLTQKGRDLKFSDDVSIGDMRRPYVQIRGEFSLGAVNISADHDGREAGTKLVDAKVGAVIQHSCFPNPLQIMGVKKGNFTQDFPPVLLFRLRDGWQLDSFVH